MHTSILKTLRFALFHITKRLKLSYAIHRNVYNILHTILLVHTFIELINPAETYNSISWIMNFGYKKSPEYIFRVVLFGHIIHVPTLYTLVEYICSKFDINCSLTRFNHNNEINIVQNDDIDRLLNDDTTFIVDDKIIYKVNADKFKTYMTNIHRKTINDECPICADHDDCIVLPCYCYDKQGYIILTHSTHYLCVECFLNLVKRSTHYRNRSIRAQTLIVDCPLCRSRAEFDDSFFLDNQLCDKVYESDCSLYEYIYEHDIPYGFI
jgi:hypothetical protein